MALVPRKGGGAARRAYNRAYAKSANGKMSSTLGKLKLSSDPIKPAKVDTRDTKANSASRREYAKSPDIKVSFGTTGFTDEEFNL